MNCSQLRQSLIVPSQTEVDQQFDDGTIASLQKVLLENRKITVDFRVELLKKIGEGATAEGTKENWKDDFKTRRCNQIVHTND